MCFRLINKIIYHLNTHTIDSYTYRHTDAIDTIIRTHRIVHTSTLVAAEKNEYLCSTVIVIYRRGKCNNHYG